MAVDVKKLKAFAKGQSKPGDSGGGGPKPKPFGGNKTGAPAADHAEPDGDEEEDDLDDEEGDETDEEIAARVGAQVKSGKVDQGLMDQMDGFDEGAGVPAFVEDEGLWDRAKAAVEPAWDEYDKPYVVVAHVYKELGGAVSSAD